MGNCDVKCDPKKGWNFIAKSLQNYLQLDYKAKISRLGLVWSPEAAWTIAFVANLNTKPNEPTKCTLKRYQIRLTMLLFSKVNNIFIIIYALVFTTHSLGLRTSRRRTVKRLAHAEGRHRYSEISSRRWVLMYYSGFFSGEIPKKPIGIGGMRMGRLIAKYYNTSWRHSLWANVKREIVFMFCQQDSSRITLSHTICILGKKCIDVLGVPR